MAGAMAAAGALGVAAVGPGFAKRTVVHRRAADVAAFPLSKCSPNHRNLPVGVAVASSAEPKWKQKLAAADEHAEKTRQATAQAQEDYNRRQADLRRQEAEGGGLVIRLATMDFIPYITEEGKIVDCTQADAKASVFAVFDDMQTLQYIGVTRQVYQSLRLHFARVPSKCYYVKVQHVTKPSRALLEGIRMQWIAENGTTPPGNDNGEQQYLWENPLDCKLLMTDEEKQLLEDSAPGPPRGQVLKNVARRVEVGIKAQIRERNCTERIFFDPKLKERALLDLKGVEIKVDKAVPTSKPQPKAAEAPSAV